RAAQRPGVDSTVSASATGAAIRTDAIPQAAGAPSRAAWIAWGLVVAFYAASVLMLPNPDIPLNDDWMYARTVRYGIETGQLTTTGYQSPWGIPQFYLGVLLSSVTGFAHAHLRWLNVASVPILLLVLTLALSRSGASFAGSVVLLASVAWFAPFF